MVKKLKEQLEIRNKWLDCPEVNYTSKDFLEDWKDYAKAVEKAHHLELIRDNTYIKCKNVLMDYICLF